MKTNFMTVCLIFLSVLPTWAQPSSSESLFAKVTEEQPICYGKEYSFSHLERHPAQTVQSLKVKLGLIKKYNQQTLNIEFTLKNDTAHFYRAGLTCIDKHCFIDCDGGSVDLQKGRDGHLSLRNNGIIVEGGCGEEVKEVFLSPKSGGDDIFNLAPLPNEFCQNTQAPPSDQE